MNVPFERPLIRFLVLFALLLGTALGLAAIAPAEPAAVGRDTPGARSCGDGAARAAG